jgi:hypothetical protein
LISHAAVVESRDLRDRHEEAHVQFTLSPDRSTWYSLVVEDVHGQKAFTDPIWVDSTAEQSQSAGGGHPDGLPAPSESGAPTQ